jgi:hypothetical protein
MAARRTTPSKTACVSPIAVTSRGRRRHASLRQFSKYVGPYSEGGACYPECEITRTIRSISRLLSYSVSICLSHFDSDLAGVAGPAGITSYQRSRLVNQIGKPWSTSVVRYLEFARCF